MMGLIPVPSKGGSWESMTWIWEPAMRAPVRSSTTWMRTGLELGLWTASNDFARVARCSKP